MRNKRQSFLHNLSYHLMKEKSWYCVYCGYRDTKKLKKKADFFCTILFFTIFAIRLSTFKTRKSLELTSFLLTIINLYIMKKSNLIAYVMCALMVVGCQTNAGTGGLLGAGGGAVLGGIVGQLIGKNTKSTVIGAAVGTAVGATAGTLIGKHMDKVKAEAEQVKNAEVQEVTDANGLDAVKVTFDSGILFATGKADLTAASKISLQELANVLKKNTNCDVAIQGYTDNVGFKGKTAAQSVELNKALSLDRAAAVYTYLQSLGVNASQVKNVEGFGQENPVASNDTEAGRKQNRRVEVYLYASQEMINAAEAGTLQ